MLMWPIIFTICAGKYDNNKSTLYIYTCRQRFEAIP